MNAFRSMAGAHLAAARDKTEQLYRSHRARKVALIATIVLVVFGLLGFLAAPPIIRGQIEKRANAALSRPVTVAAVHFNPYTLRLQLDRLHIADRDGRSPFVDIDQAVINASWTSLFRWAPVLDELRLQHPRIRVVRTADGRFNFTDLLERYASKPADPNAPPARFSLSNITVHAGDIQFDDQIGKASHHVEQLELGIPFIANLPSDTDVFVQPLLSLRVDGSPLRIDSQTKPFADTREAVVHFQLDQLDLPRYLAYVPVPLPVAIPKGRLGGNLDLHFVQTKPTPQLQLTGHLHLDDFALASNRGEPILELGHGSAELADVQPLLSRYRLGALRLDQAHLHYTQGDDGRSNFDSLTAGPAAPAPTSATTATPTDLRIASLALTNSAVRYTDATQHELVIDNLHGSLQGLSLQPAPAGPIDLAARLGGGELTAKGKLDLAASRLVAHLGFKQVGVAPLQAMAPPTSARVTRGKLDADGQLQLDWGKAFNVHLADAHAAINDFALEAPSEKHGTPLAWNKLQAEIRLLDLASRQMQLGKVTASGLGLDVQRRRNGTISLLELLAPPSAPRKAAADPGPPWHWSIAHLGLDDGTVDFTDQAVGSKPVTVQLKSLKGSLDNLSDKLGEARPFKLEGAIDRGTFAASGTLRPSPLGADLQLDTRRLDIARFEPYISVPLNVTVTNARLTSNGKLRYDGRGNTPKLRYRGNAALERVRIQDKLSGDDFLRWRTLSAANLDAEVGPGAPRMHVGALALTSFYARMIINADGKLNLADVIASPEAAPVSVTRATGTSATPPPKPAAPIPTAATSTSIAAAAAPAAPPADIHIGGITLVNGQLNYTDNFIKPNYTANLTKLTGRIGAFGTTPGDPPAALSVQAALDDDSPVDIDGSINPLQPVAFLDIKGKANEVELTRLAAYSTKYTGYPITAGKLNMDVHYMLDQRKLNADNHIFITQLTFGERNESPGIRHLPVKLAVALLKDTQGNIDVNVPVSGSLDDPQFSLGGLIWRAFGNLIAKAVTAPFRLLAGAFGGSHEDLGYVEFAPGSAVLDAKAQERLGKIVAMLQQKPSLKLGIIGRVDPSKDQDGLRKVTVDNLVRREKALDTEGKSADTSDAALAAVKVTPDEYDKYLKRAYRHDDLQNKPRNFLGLKKSLEPDEMRSLMETDVPVDDKAMRALAERRAGAVQAWLKGKLDDARVSLQEPKLDAEGIDDKGKTTRVDFGLKQ